MYEYTDKIVLIARKRFIRVFNRYKAQLHIDELNVLKQSEAMYGELEEIAEYFFLKIARRYYKGYVKKPHTDIDRDWLLDMLEDYEPTVEYVYTHEVERKRARFAESVIASGDKTKPFDKALRYWNDMFTQYAILTTDKAVVNAYKDNGIKRLRWRTEEDEKVCGACSILDGKTYDIDKLPPKPHWRCRCWWLPVKG